MNTIHDMTTTIGELKKTIATFVEEREWNQFHSPKSLSMAIAIEASELMEKFLWLENSQSHEEAVHNRQEVEDELADILIALIAFANATEIDLSKALVHKLTTIRLKYPIEKAKGRSTKYNKL